MPESTDIGALLQALPLPMWVYDPDTLRILAVNEAAVQVYGWSADELTERTIADLGTEDERGRMKTESQRRFPSRQRSAAVWRHRHRDGSEVDVLVRTSSVAYDGKPCRLAIVEAMSSTSALSAVAARAEAIINSSNDAVVSMRLDGTITTWNPAAERIFGYRETEILGAGIELLTDERHEEATQIRQRVAGGGRPVIYETELLRADGAAVAASVTLFPICDSNGRVNGLCAIARDITETRKATERDRCVAKLNSLALGDTPLADVLVAAARALDSFLGLEAASVLEKIGNDQLLLVAGTGWAPPRIGATTIAGRADSLFGVALEAAGTTIVDFTFDIGDPHKPAAPQEPATRRTVIAPVRLEGAVWGAVAAHWREREPSAAERSFVEHFATAVAAAVTRSQRETMRQRSEELARLAAVGQLAAGVCHDFNNVLTVVQLAAERLRRTEELSAAGLAQLDLVRGQLDHASSMIWQILDFARARPFDSGVLELGRLVEALGGIITAVAGRRITLSVRTGRGPLRVLGDPVRLQQVMMNLVTNARDAMPDGGTLLVVVSRRVVTSLEEGVPPGLEAGTWICLEVSDTGTGMPEEVRAHAFEPFFTTRGPGKGTGLGLAQVASLVAQHDGHVGLTSVEGRGTTVTVWLPPAAEEATGGDNLREPDPLTEWVEGGIAGVSRIEEAVGRFLEPPGGTTGGGRQ